MNPTTYSYEEAFQATLAYFDGDELAARVWVNKYAMKDSFGNIYEKSPADMHHRLAAEMARIERKYPNPVPEEEIFSVLDHFRFIIPAGSPMTGIGNNHQVASLSNCFVIGIDGDADSYGAIMKEDEEQVAHEAPRRRWTRPLAHPPERFPGEQFRPDFNGSGALHGTFLQLHTRGGARRTPRRPDAFGEHQAPRR